MLTRGADHRGTIAKALSVAASVAKHESPDLADFGLAASDHCHVEQRNEGL